MDDDDIILSREGQQKLTAALAALHSAQISAHAFPAERGERLVRFTMDMVGQVIGPVPMSAALDAFRSSYDEWQASLHRKQKGT